MTTKQLLDDGSYACMGADITVDAVPIAFVRANPELIVVAFQRWDACPDEWEVDNVQSLIETNEHIRANYAVDQKRVYAIGSSMGTMITSEAMMSSPRRAAIRRRLARLSQTACVWQKLRTEQHHNRMGRSKL